MAYAHGTATDRVDLWNKLLDFLKNNAALVAAGQNWTQVWTHPTDTKQLILKGPGLSGQDSVYVGLWRQDDRWTVGESTINITGCTGIIPTAATYTDHVNSLVRAPMMFLDQNAMEYWFVANGRRFVVVVKITTIYQAMYGGFFMPYAPPDTYPAPIFVGGTQGFSAGSDSVRAMSWRASTRPSYSQFPRSFSDQAGGSTYYDASGCFLKPSGMWAGCNADNDLVTYNLDTAWIGPSAFPRYLGPNINADIYYEDYGSYNDQSTLGYESMRERLVAGLNGEVPLLPILLSTANPSSSPNPVSYGILDGCYSIGGQDQSVENIITADGVDHLVVQNVQRTGRRDYWALALE